MAEQGPDFAEIGQAFDELADRLDGSVEEGSGHDLDAWLALCARVWVSRKPLGPDSPLDIRRIDDGDDR